MSTFWESVKKWSATIGVAAVALLYFLFQRRGEQIAKLESTVRLNKADSAIDKATTESNQQEVDYEQKKDSYDSLKRKHADIAGELGLGRDDSKS